MSKRLDRPQDRAFVRFVLASVALVVLGIAFRWHLFLFDFCVDDFLQREFLDGSSRPHAAWNLYAFIPNRAVLEAGRFVGNLPWWIADDAKMYFFRPIPSLTLALDIRLFKLSAAFAHVHSFVWWSALVAAVAWLYAPPAADGKRPAHAGTLTLVPACIALAAYVLDEAHSDPLLCIANRHSIIAAFFGVLTLGLQVRSHVSGRRADRFGAIAMFVLALLSSEYAVSTIGFLLSFEAFAKDTTIAGRIRRVAPFVLLGCVYVVLHSKFGYGARGLGPYVDPRQEPARFLSNASIQYVFLLESVLAGLNSEAGFLVAGVLLFVALRWVPRTRPWLVGALLALVPVCLVLNFSSRQLILPAVGVSAALGLVVGRAIEIVRSRSRVLPRVLAGLATAVLLASHLVLSPLKAQAFSDYRFDDDLGHLQRVLSADVDDEAIPGQRLLLLSTTYWSDSYTFADARSSFGHPRPRSVITASTVPGPRTVKRVSEQEIDVELPPATLPIGPPPFASRLAVGDAVDVDGARVTLLARNEFGPTAIRLRLEGPVDDQHWCILVSTQQGYRRFRLPQVGEAAATESM